MKTHEQKDVIDDVVFNDEEKGIDDFNGDSLLFCLVQLARYWQRPSSAHALLSGLPASDPISADLLIRAAENIDLASHKVNRPLDKISNFILPAVLLLKDHQACLLLGFSEDFKTARILSPDLGTQEISISVAELEESYIGTAILTRPKFRFDARSRETSEHQDKTWFWGTLQRFWSIYTEVILASIVINVFVLASPLFVMNVYDRVVPNNALDTLWVLAIGVSLVYGFDLILRSLRGFMLDKAGKKADVLMANRIFQQIMNVRLAEQPASTGALTKNIQEFESLREFFTSATLTALIDFPFIFLFLLVMWYIGGDVAFVPFLAIPIILGICFFVQAPLMRIMQRSAKEAAQKNALMVEAISGVESIRIMGAESIMQHKWEQYVDVLSRSSMKSRLLSSISINLSLWVQQMATVGVIVYGAHLISTGDMTMGALFACTILTGRAMSPLGKVASILVRLQQSKVSLTTLDKIMNLPVERPVDKKFIHRPHLMGEVLFEKVAFRYPEQAIDSLANISCKIKAGEKVAIIGRIGSGKSTLLKLILGLYQPYQGNVLLDGVDIRQLDPADVRKNIGCVPQSSVLFFGTLKDNIAMGNRFASDAQILEAAQIAGINEFASLHPMGFDMMIGEQGKGLSGGQQQMVIIARALLANPSLLLLDEPASQLDRGSEAQLINRLHQYVANKTLILITHKSSLLSLVDRLIVVESGHIIADGPKEKVLEEISSGKLATQIQKVNSDVLEQLSQLKSSQEKFINGLTEQVEPNAGDYKRMQHEDNRYVAQGRLPFLKLTFFTHLSVILMSLMVMIGGVWAYYAELDEVTIGLGKVIPSRKIQLIQNLEGGIISDILVKEGDIVKKGDILLHIDDTQFQSSFRESQVHYLAKLAKKIRLEAEANNKIFIPPIRTEPEWLVLMNNEKQLYSSRHSSLQAAIGILEKQVQQRQQEHVELKAMKRQLNKRLDLLQKELDLVKPIVAKKLMSEIELLRLQRELSELTGKLEGTRLAIPRVKSIALEAEEKVEESKINFRTEAFRELNELNAELARLTESMTGLEDKVVRTSVQSPVKGTVIRMLINTTGEVVRAGMNLLEIMPLEDSLLVEAKIRPEDIGFLHPGQNVIVKFTAYDFSIYGGLIGRLEHISADAITDEKDERFYLIQVRTDQKYLGTEDKPLPIISGMEANVNILTGKKTVMDYILKPILKAKYNALRER